MYMPDTSHLYIILTRRFARRSSDPKNLQFMVEMIQSQGASLEKNVSNWYENFGGVSWDMEITEGGETNFEISEKVSGNSSRGFSFASLHCSNSSLRSSCFAPRQASSQSKEAFAQQCEVAAADAFSRLVSSGRGTSGLRGESIANFDFSEEGRRKALLNTPTPANSGSVGAQGGSLGGSWGEHMQGVRDGIASRLAWTLKVQPRGELALASALLDKSLESLPEEGADNIQRAAKLRALRDKYPLVPAVLNRDFVNGNASSRGPKTSEPNLASRTLYEAYVSDLDKDSADSGTYESAVDALTMSMAHVHTVAAMKQTDKQLSLPKEYLRRNAAKVSENPSSGGSRSLRSLGNRYARHLLPLHCSNSSLRSSTLRTQFRRRLGRCPSSLAARSKRSTT